MEQSQNNYQTVKETKHQYSVLEVTKAILMHLNHNSDENVTKLVHWLVWRILYNWDIGKQNNVIDDLVRLLAKNVLLKYFEVNKTLPLFIEERLYPPWMDLKLPLELLDKQSSYQKTDKNELSQACLKSILTEIVTAWEDCNATVIVPPEPGTSRLFKAIRMAKEIIKTEY